MRTKTNQETLPAVTDDIIEQLRRRSTYVPPGEARKIMCASKETLCRWVNEGQFKGGVYRLGNKNVFNPQKLADWIEARRMEPSAFEI